MSSAPRLSEFSLVFLGEMFSLMCFRQPSPCFFGAPLASICASRCEPVFLRLVELVKPGVLRWGEEYQLGSRYSIIHSASFQQRHRVGEWSLNLKPMVAFPDLGLVIHRLLIIFNLADILAAISFQLYLAYHNTAYNTEVKL